MKPKNRLALYLGVIGLVVGWAGAACSQTSNLGCRLEEVGNTSRHVLSCPSGVRITAEAGARYTLMDRDGDGSADGVILRRKAMLLVVPPAHRPRGFIVSTPQAIAAVRGTKWAVDVGGGKTAVFVVEGRVAVERANATGGVVLRPGEGVDVERGTGPLTVRRWPEARVSALLSRLGE